MEQLLNNNSWIIYPTEKGQDVILTITFSTSDKYDKIIQTLIKKYGGELGTCKLGNHTRMITLKNLSIIELFSRVFSKNAQSTSEIYQEYMHLYNNQHVYFESMFMI